jgi:hypothetical protein
VKHDVLKSGTRAEMDGGDGWLHELPNHNSRIYELLGDIERPLPPLPQDEE